MRRGIPPLRDTGKDEKAKGCLRCNEEMGRVKSVTCKALNYKRNGANAPCRGIKEQKLHRGLPTQAWL